MGRGRSGRTGLNLRTKPNTPQETTPESNATTNDVPNWREAFTVIDRHNREKEWRDFAKHWQDGVTQADLNEILAHGWNYGYVATSHSFDINERLYSPANANKTIEEIFNDPRDVRTVRTLDKLIQNHGTPRDAFYTRYSGASAIKSIFGLSDAQMAAFTPGNIAMLNKALAGSTSTSKSFTSASANSSLNVFKGKRFERRLYVPAGTRSYGVTSQDDESEVIFGRNLNTRLVKITYENNHYVLHEMVTGYKKSAK